MRQTNCLEVWTKFRCKMQIYELYFSVYHQCIIKAHVDAVAPSNVALCLVHFFFFFIFHGWIAETSLWLHLIFKVLRQNCSNQENLTSWLCSYFHFISSVIHLFICAFISRHYLWQKYSHQKRKQRVWGRTLTQSSQTSPPQRVLLLLKGRDPVYEPCWLNL